jgi:hypothetical protein
MKEVERYTKTVEQKRLAVAADTSRPSKRKIALHVAREG